MKTMRERIVKAAMAMYERVYGDDVPWSQDYSAQRLMMGRVEDVLKDAFPELFASPPTHWLAPRLLSPEMVEAISARCFQCLAAGGWDTLRDTCLSQERKP